MTLLEQLQEEMKAALRAGEKDKLVAIRMALSDMKYAQVEKGRPLEDVEMLAVIERAVKKRKESVAAYESAGREDLAQKERNEMQLLEKFLPVKITGEELTGKLKELLTELGASGKKDFPKAMKEAMTRFRGMADGAEVRRLIERLLTTG